MISLQGLVITEARIMITNESYSHRNENSNQKPLLGDTAKCVEERRSIDDVCIALHQHFPRRYIDLDPKDSQRLSERARIFQESESWEKALDYYRKALDKDPDNRERLTRKANACLQLGLFAEAYRDCATVFTETPNAELLKIGGKKLQFILQIPSLFMFTHYLCSVLDTKMFVFGLILYDYEKVLTIILSFKQATSM